jgi:hypothetical protein
MNKINFEVGQNVHCPLFGFGVVSKIDEGKKDLYPVRVTFNDGGIRSYALNGTFFCGVNPTLKPAQNVVTDKHRNELEQIKELCVNNTVALTRMLKQTEITQLDYNKLVAFPSRIIDLIKSI